jgi:hypothetical protein
LVDQSEVELFGSLNPDVKRYNNLSKYTDKEGFRFISTVKYLQKIYICPRDIYSHNDNPYRCGRVCNNMMSVSDNDGWSRDDATMYLIAYKK